MVAIKDGNGRSPRRNRKLEELERKVAFLDFAERLHREAMEAARIATWEWLTTKGEFRLNPGWFKLLGLKGTEVPRSSSEYFELMHPADRQRVNAAMAQFVERKEEHWSCAFRMLHRDGSYRQFFQRGTLVKRGRVVGADIDVTP